MSRPGVLVTSRAEPPPRSAPTQAGMAFVLGQVATDGAAYKAISTLSQYEAEYGERTGDGVALHDAVEVFLREGGTRLTVVPLATNDDDGLADALDALPRALGPGQVLLAAGDAFAVDTDTHAALVAHAVANNRIALLDADDEADADALGTLAAAHTNDEVDRYVALFAPAAVVPGLTSEDTRTVPYSVVQAGIISRNDATLSPNVAAAGVNGQSRFAIDLTATFTDAEREELNDAGVNIARLVYGGVRTYGYRTLASLDSGWGMLSNARLNMEIVAKCEAVAERYLFAQIDGRRVKLGQFGADLSGVLVPYYESGSLFGESVDDAFYVDVGPQVNTLESIAAGELHAIVGLRMSPFAEYVVVEIVKAATDVPLSTVA